MFHCSPLYNCGSPRPTLLFFLNLFVSNLRFPKAAVATPEPQGHLPAAVVTSPGEPGVLGSVQPRRSYHTPLLK